MSFSAHLKNLVQAGSSCRGSRAGWFVMQGVSRRLAHYAGDLAAQAVVSGNIEGWRKGKATKNGSKKYVGVACK